MRYLNKRRHAMASGTQNRGFTLDPMDGVANLFDIGLVFIVGLIVALFSTYRLHDLFNAESEMTIVTKTKDGEMEIITKSKRKIEARKVTHRMGQGEGQRMGVAYRLEDGSMVYVPDGDATAAE